MVTFCRVGQLVKFGFFGTPLVIEYYRHTRKPGETSMDNATFQARLTELMKEISVLPRADRDKLTQIAKETRDRHTKLQQTVHNLQESLDYLRLSIKYLVFDLEATRRENTYLRKMIDHDEQDGDPHEI